MIASARLFLIESKRNTGLFAVPILIGLALAGWFIQQNEHGSVVTLWSQASANIGFMVVLVGPAAGGLAAWVAGRDRRRGLGDLLATTPRPATARDLNLLFATGLWPLLAYIAAAVALGIITAQKATWGGPVAAPIVIGGLAIVVQAAIGYAIGLLATSAIFSRLIAGLVPVGLFFAEILAAQLTRDQIEAGLGSTTNSYPYENLSPYAIVQHVSGTVFWAPRMEIVWWSAVWFVGIGALALAFIVLRRSRHSFSGWVVATIAVVAVVSGYTHLVPALVPYQGGPPKAIAFEVVCTQRSIPICLHPAYEPLLEETADLVDPVIRPLAGLPGFPARAEQLRPANDSDDAILNWLYDSSDPNSMPIEPICADLSPKSQAVRIAFAAVSEPSTRPFDISEAQNAIVIWLVSQAGYDQTSTIEFDVCSSNGGRGSSNLIVAPAILQAADRFEALTLEQQHAWLQANFAALRAGQLSLDDMP